MAFSRAPRTGQIVGISTRIAGLQKELEEEVPDKPQKPYLMEPIYRGVVPLSGSCRGRYKDNQGIVIEADGKYYVVKGADPCVTPYVKGYVEMTGETVRLAIGRSGRQAAVVVLKDHETYVDDQKAFRDKVAQNQAKLEQETKGYPQAVRTWRDAFAAISKKRRSAIETRDQLAARWFTVLGCGAPPASSAGPGRRDGVDRQCYDDDGWYCRKRRLADAEALDDLVGAAIVQVGFPAGCYRLRYFDSDHPGKDAITVIVAAACRPDAKVSKPQLAQLARTLSGMIAGKPLAANVDVVEVTDGDELAAQVPLT